MKVNDLLILVRQRLGDMQKTTFSDVELIYCLNNAMDRLSIELSEQSNPEMSKEFTLRSDTETERPVDFISLRGQYPIEFKRNGGKTVVVHANPEFDGEMIVKYFAMRPHVSSLEDDIPFDQGVHHRILVIYTVYDAKPSLEAKTNDSTRTNE